jgi:hypothetical protein
MIGPENRKIVRAVLDMGETAIPVNREILKALLDGYDHWEGEAAKFQEHMINLATAISEYHWRGEDGSETIPDYCKVLLNAECPREEPLCVTCALKWAEQREVR